MKVLKNAHTNLAAAGRRAAGLLVASIPKKEAKAKTTPEINIAYSERPLPQEHQGTMIIGTAIIKRNRDP